MVRGVADDQGHVMGLLRRAMRLMPRDMVLTDCSARRSFVVRGDYEDMVVAMSTTDALRHEDEPGHPVPIVCYVLTSDGAAVPPVLRFDQVVTEKGPMSDGGLDDLLGFHAQTGVLNTTTEEIAQLVGQLERAIATLRPDEYHRG